LERRGFRYVVISEGRDEIDGLRARGIPAVYGDAAHPEMLALAGIEHARLVIVASSDPHETRLIVERARTANPNVDFVVRTHSDVEAAHLRSLGKVQPIHGEREMAVQMARYALRRFGVSGTEAEAIAQGLRGRAVVIDDPHARRTGRCEWIRVRFRRRSAVQAGTAEPADRPVGSPVGDPADPAKT
jgi:CPA2 family monovalent cation:H+ antiporter-2